MFHEYEKILVPIDGSKEAKLAFDKAIEVAKRNHAKLVLAHVIDTRSLQTPAGFEGNFSDEIRKQAENLFAEYVEDANALKNFINVFEISIYELRIINVAVKGLSSVAITKCENVDQTAAGVAFYLKHFFNEPQSFIDDKYTITFRLQTKYTNIFLVIFFAMMLFMALNGTTHWKAPNPIINSILMLTCTVFLAHRFFNHKKLYNQPMYRINKAGLTIFVNVNLYGVNLLPSPKFISWDDITAIDAYRSFWNRGYYRKGPIDCARLYTKSNLKFAEGKSNSTYEIQFGELGGNAQVELRTLILYWMIFKSI